MSGPLVLLRPGPSSAASGRGWRHHGCRYYAACLERADLAGWPGWTCGGCPELRGHRVSDVSQITPPKRIDRALTLAAIAEASLEVRAEDIDRCGGCGAPTDRIPSCACHLRPGVPDERAELTWLPGVCVEATDPHGLRRHHPPAAGCAVHGCGGAAHLRGLCRRHYREQLQAEAARCVVPGCPLPVYALDRCSTHYQRQRRARTRARGMEPA